MKYRYCTILFLTLSYQVTIAGPLAEKAGVDLAKQPTRWQSVKKGLKKIFKLGTKQFPGAEAAVSLMGLGDGLEEKVDRIEEKQATSLDRLSKLAKEALRTKEKVEELYYFQKRSQARAQALAQQLRRGKCSKFLGALLEEGLQIPINPGRYIPDTPYTRKLIENLELDLSLEKDVLGQGDYFLRDTRAALLSSGLHQKNPDQFAREYQKAAAYERELQKALKAKEQVKIKIYKEEIARLAQALVLLEQAKTKPGLTVGDVVQLELAIDAKRKAIRELNEQVTQGIQEGLALSTEQKEALARYQAHRDLAIMEQYMIEDRKRIKEKYRHWW